MSKEAAHSFARVVRVKGDQAGAAIMRTLVKEVLNTPSITVMQGLTALDLIVKNNEMCGVVVASGEKDPFVIQAKAYLMAAGGAGSLFMKTTNPPTVRARVSQSRCGRPRTSRRLAGRECSAPHAARWGPRTSRTSR